MKIWSWILSGILIFSSPFGAIAQQSKSKSKPSVNKLKTNLKSVEAKKRALSAEIKKTKREASAVLGDIQWADKEVDKFEVAIDSTEAKLAEDRKAQRELARDLKESEEELAIQQIQLRNRLRAMYMQQTKSPVAALVESRSLGDLAIRKSVLERIASEDRELFEGYKAKVAVVATKKKQQDAVVQRIADLIQRQKDYQQELKVAVTKKKGYLNELTDKASDLREQYAALDRESDSIAAQIRAYQSVNTGGTAFRGGFIKPVNARISSGYGNRFHPILKRTRLHAGVDFAARTGTPIRATASGTVIFAGYRGGYGNTVIIDHGGGVSSLYGHCSRLFVGSGAKVRQGQTIAAVGSTGLSTGPHLHFEIRVNGRPVNPMSRL